MPIIPIPVDLSLYKFLHRKDVPHILEAETLRICTPSYYQRRFSDIEGNSGWIYDGKEGKRIFQQRRTITGSHDITEDERAFLAECGIRPPAWWRGSIGGNRLHLYTKPVHILCLTDHDPHIARHAFDGSKPMDVPPYDACIKFASVAELADLISCGAVLLPNGPVPCAEVFTDTRGGKVVYLPQTFDWSDRSKIYVDIWEKDVQFADQREYRLAFNHRDGWRLPEELTLHVPGLRRIVSEISF